MRTVAMLVGLAALLLAAPGQAATDRYTAEYYKGIGETMLGKSAQVSAVAVRAIQGATTAAAELKDYLFFEVYTVDPSERSKATGSLLLAVPKGKAGALAKKVGLTSENGSINYYDNRLKVTRLRGTLQKVVVEVPGDLASFRWVDLGVFEGQTRQLTAFCLVLPDTP